MSKIRREDAVTKAEPEVEEFRKHSCVEGQMTLMPRQTEDEGHWESRKPRPKVSAANRLCRTAESSIIELLRDGGSRLGLQLRGPGLDLLLEDLEAPPPLRLNRLVDARAT